MSPEIIGGAILSAVGLFIIVAYLLRRVERAKEQRGLKANRAAWQLKRTANALERIPSAFLTKNLKRILARMMQTALTTITKHDPKFKGLPEYQQKAQRFFSSVDAEPPSQHPLLTPADRKEAVSSLRDVRKLLADARRQGLIQEVECVQQQSMIDTMLVRLVVDHLKQNAFNAEAVHRYDDAVRYLQRAMESLSLVNDRNRHREELLALGNDITRLREVLRSDLEKRRGSANNLLKAMTEQGSKEEIEASRLALDS